MRVLHVLDHSLPLHSGYSFRTAAILHEQRARGWKTVQLTSPRQGCAAELMEQIDGLTFFRTPYSQSWLAQVPLFGTYLDEMAATERRMDALARECCPDLLHAHSPVLNVLPALRVGQRRGIPVVYEVRACWEDAAVDHGATFEGSLRYRVTRGLETYALRRADAVTVICDGLRREFEGRGIASSKITVIPNAVDVLRFRFGPDRDCALRAQLGLEGMTVIGFVGSFYAYEGLDLLLQALEQVLRFQLDIRLLLVGGGPQEAPLKKLAAELGLESRVIFAGRVPHSDVQRFYDVIDILCYPRRSMRLTELVTPLKPLEAMAQGAIFVASDVGGHRELVRDGDTGFLFEAGSVSKLTSAIGRAMGARDCWDEMRARARRYVETERTWSQSVARYAPLYEQLCARASTDTIG